MACTAEQLYFFNPKPKPYHDPTIYRPILTISENKKGVVDVDTVKGCTLGMSAYPNLGCYGECYANKNATRYGINFSLSVSRKIMDREHLATLLRILSVSKSNFYRIGVAGDPCHDWENTVVVCRALRHANKIPVIITKHWLTLTDGQIDELRKVNAVFNTSTSGLDTDEEIKHRIGQLERLRLAGVRSVCRVVTCKFGNTEWSRVCNDKQNYLLSFPLIIDNPLRTNKNNLRVLSGEILVENIPESIGGGKIVSRNSKSSYLGTCKNCVDQCGIDTSAIKQKQEGRIMKQAEIFSDKIEFEYVKSVIGSGYEKDVARLALEDGIAHRAARKNMQIHSAIILKINDKFKGFFTFQNNEEVKEFCLLQSVIEPENYSDELYKQMALEVLKKNVNNFPAIMTTNPKSKFETPKVYNSLGFKTYLAMSGFEYMVNGRFEDIRMKLLAHITMTNVWNSTGAYWLRIKKDWKEQIEKVGERLNVPNPMFASRDGCWQGTSGFSNVVAGKSHNGNASVLDPTACEVVLRFFIPTNGKRIYNPFGGGVQFGFVSGHYGYEYVASEIRQNQCDANNLLCSEFENVKWIHSDSSKYEPNGMFDLVFTCPPYYKVEKYIDYDGCSPDGEINSMSTYEEFRDALFSGYSIAIDHLNDNCFFIVMTGDSRDSKGAYYASEAETIMFLKSKGLSIYNLITYLECEFTRLAQAKKTLNMRKFPKREQKIIVAYKGDIKSIKDNFPPIGRL